jgi:hypothetical protein
LSTFAAELIGLYACASGHILAGTGRPILACLSRLRKPVSSKSIKNCRSEGKEDKTGGIDIVKIVVASGTERNTVFDYTAVIEGYEALLLESFELEIVRYRWLLKFSRTERSFFAIT